MDNIAVNKQFNDVQINVSCKSCGSDNLQHLLNTKTRYAGMRIEQYALVKCKDCGLIYVLPDPPKQDLDKLYGSDDYLEDLFDAPQWRNWVTTSHWLPVLQQIENHIGVGKILDIGCSDGLFMDLAKSQNWDTYGCDLNGEKLQRAIKKYGSKARTCDAGSMENWTDQEFDVVRLCHVLEHLTDPDTALDNIHQILRTGGIFNLGIPIFDEMILKMISLMPNMRLRDKLTKIFGWVDPPHHINTWSTNAIVKTLNKHGFEVIWKSYRSDVFPWVEGFRHWNLLFRLVDIPMKLLSTGATIEILAKKV